MNYSFGLPASGMLLCSWLILRCSTAIGTTALNYPIGRSVRECSYIVQGTIAKKTITKAAENVYLAVVRIKIEKTLKGRPSVAGNSLSAFYHFGFGESLYKKNY